jgi:hypothetical protein
MYIVGACLKFVQFILCALHSPAKNCQIFILCIILLMEKQKFFKIRQKSGLEYLA